MADVGAGIGEGGSGPVGDDRRDDEVVTPPPPPPVRGRFHAELDEIRQTIARLAATVTEDIPRATEVLLSQDLVTAERMIVADDEVDATCIALEQRCYRVLALQAPVASDLREVVAAMRIIAEVERSADLTVNVCRCARRLYGHALPPRTRGLIRRMGEQASRLFREASEAYLLRDPVRAAAVSDMDDMLDSLQREFVAALFEGREPDAFDLPTAVQLAVLARFYERIGDHAVTIGERVRYLVTGEISDRRA
jgi:phosphate transport system protein